MSVESWENYLGIRRSDALAGWKKLRIARRSDTFKFLWRYNSAALSRRRVLQLTVALLESEQEARAFEDTRPNTGRVRQPIRRAAEKLSNATDAEILAWLDPPPEARLPPWWHDICWEVERHIRRAAGDGFGNLSTARKALVAIGEGEPVPPPSPDTIAMMEQIGATPWSPRRESNAAADDLVLKLAVWFWELSDECPGYSATKRKASPRKSFQAFIAEWVEAGGREGRGFRNRIASARRMRAAVDRCKKSRCRVIDRCHAEPRCKMLKLCKKAVLPIGLRER